MAVQPLRADALNRPTDAAGLGFETTADLPNVTDIVGQDRAVEAVAFAMEVRSEGYNVFAVGPEGTGKRTLIRQSLARAAARQPVADGWCYVFNFQDPRRPRALRLPAGRATALHDQIGDLVRELSAALPAAFEADDYRARRLALEEQFKQRRDAALAELEQQGSQRSIALVRTPMGFGVAPVHGTEVLEPEQFNQLPAAEQALLKAAMSETEDKVQELLATIPAWEREHRKQVEELNRGVVAAAVAHLIAELRAEFRDLAEVDLHLRAVETDLIAHAEDFIQATSRVEQAPTSPAEGTSTFHRYEINVIVDHAGEHGAPVVDEDLPTQPNLLGRIEHLAIQGALLTDFTLIKGGALHRANGGYLVLDARRLLQQPFAWDELKRALRSRELRLDGLPQAVGWLTTASIEPEPIPLDVKVVLIGDRLIFALLSQMDPEVAELFKVPADFEDWIERTAETERRYAQLMATIARTEGLRALEAPAVAAVLDHAVRIADDVAKLSTAMGRLADVLRESNAVAARAGAQLVSREHVVRAIADRRRRASRSAEQVRDAIARGMLRVETTGAVTGQVEGLSVAALGDGTFGWPVRITAQMQLGPGDVIDIEREVELGGPIHSKGVLILSGFLGGRFGRTRPLALQGSLVFEQSYGVVEGDSASVAELCALLSAIAGVPASQSLAVTGSVDQLGRCQAVGGINEKIEGFFDVCSARGLTGRQGVIIPSANVQSLMLEERVVAAARAGRFAIYGVETVDEAMELLTGLPAGEPDADGHYPSDTLNGRVERQLERMAEVARLAAGGDKGRPARPGSVRARAVRPG